MSESRDNPLAAPAELGLLGTSEAITPLQYHPGVLLGNPFLAGLANTIKAGVEGIANLVRFPGDVAAGRYSLPEITEKTPEFALSLAGMGMGIPKPPGVLGIMGGERAAASLIRPEGASELEVLSKARNMEMESGATDKQIFEETGWYRGADNKWRFVIPDKDAEFGPGIKRNYANAGNQFVGIPPLGTTTLGEVLKHDDLFAAYPWLKDVKVQSVPLTEFMQGTRGGSAPGRIWLGPGHESEVMSNLLHEVQHQIQGYEGFAAGGGWRQFLPASVTKPTDAQMLEAYNKYIRLGGEVESNLVQEQYAQRDWSRLPQEYPGYIPKEQQIIRFRPQTNPQYQLVPVGHNPFEAP